MIKILYAKRKALYEIGEILKHISALQKRKFSIKGFSNKCDQIRSF